MTDVVSSASNVDRNSQGVLLVCANDNTLATLASILHQSNVSALTAQHSADAWDCIKAGAVGLVIQDLTQVYPDMLTLFRSCRSCQATAHIPFLFLIKNDSSITILDSVGPEITSDMWLTLPCSAQVFMSAVYEMQDQIAMCIEPPITEKSLENVKDSESDEKIVTAKPRHLDTLQHDVHNAIFTGQIGHLDVTKILSMIEPLRLTGILRVADDKRAGSVHFVSGAARHAEINEIEGSDALFLLFHLKTGMFRFDAIAPTDKRTIEGNTMALLLEGLRQMDEAKAAVKAFRDKRPTTIHQVP